MHQIIFIEGFSGIGKSTLAKKLHEHYKGVYIEQYMMPDFKTKDGINEITGKEEDETLYALMVANIKEFCRLGYQNIISLDFNPVRFRDIPNDFKGYDFVILHLTCQDKQQNLTQMANREKGGLIDFDMIEQDYKRAKLFPKPLLPNSVKIDVTGKTPDQVFEMAINLINNTKSQLDYYYEMPDKRCYDTWVQADRRRV